MGEQDLMISQREGRLRNIQLYPRRFQAAALVCKLTPDLWPQVNNNLRIGCVVTTLHWANRGEITEEWTCVVHVDVCAFQNVAGRRDHGLLGGGGGQQIETLC